LNYLPLCNLKHFHCRTYNTRESYTKATLTARVKAILKACWRQGYRSCAQSINSIGRDTLCRSCDRV